MAHIVWYSENMKEKQLSFIQRPKLSKKKQKKQFGADADIYMIKKWWNTDASHVNQWDLYNNIAYTYII